jgi:uncharacterized membrane protein YqjE
MAAENGGLETVAPKGFFDSLKTLLSAFLELLETRLHLISAEVELEEEKFKEIAFLAGIAFFCVNIGVIVLTFLVVVFFAEAHRLYALAAFVLFYFGVALIAVLSLRRKTRTKPKIFSATLSELAKDREYMNR